MRTISSPGVEVRERDISLGPIFPVGTNIFLTGFTSKGPADEVVQITNSTELENVFGIPTTPAERYLYYTASNVLNYSNGNLYINRLPYGADLGSGFGSTYGALVYPAITHSASLTAANNLGFDFTPTDSIYFIGKPKFFELTLSEYLSVLDGSAFTWQQTGAGVGDITSIADFGKSAMVVLNKGQSTTNDKFEGYYIGLADNTNLLPSTNYDSIIGIESVQETTDAAGTTTYTKIPTARLGFALSASATSNGDSVSHILENIPSFDTFSKTYDDTVSLGVFKIRQSPYGNDVTSLGYVFDGGYNASFDYYRQLNSAASNLPQSYFISRVTDNSSNVTILVNDNISNRMSTTWLDANGNPTKKVRILSTSIKTQLAAELTATNLITASATAAWGALSSTTLSATPLSAYLEDVDYSSVENVSTQVGVNTTKYNAAISAVGTADELFSIGAYVYDAGFTDKNLGNIPLKLTRVLSRVENDEIYNIDLIAEAGLGTIYTTMCANETTYFDDTKISEKFLTGLTALTKTQEYNPGSDERSDIRASYMTIFNKFAQFAEFSRKDCLFIADPLRQIFVRGANTKVLTNPENPFSMYIYNSLRHLYEQTNTSYSVAYANWGKVRDIFTGIDTWVPFSGVVATDMAIMDQTYYPWYAPAGFTRGRVAGLIDLAIIPKQKERDQLYKIGLNPVTLMPGEGYVIFGQKTLLNQPSVFSRINVRRLFLYCEKATKRTAKYYVFEPNTYITRTRFINALTPIFEKAQNNEGIIEFLIVCDSRNNTPDVIDENELVADIYIKPVHASEFVLVNFYATRTATNFNELIGG